MSKKIFIYDTTLRDGAQGAKISLTAEDKLVIAKKLDELGVDYIEGGWPVKGVNEKDMEFFRKVKKLKLKSAKIAAFGSTRRVKNKVNRDPFLNTLIEADTPVITIFGKTWDLHVQKVLNTTNGENLKIIRESVGYLKSKGREIIFDAEHFFDGFRANPEYALLCLKAAEEGGADWIVLCDTNGGTTVSEMDRITKDVAENVEIPLGIHTHNDSELAVANSIIAVNNGYTQVQGTINGFGERCGNANLVSIMPILTLKMDYETIPEKNFKKLSEVSHYIYDIANIPPNDSQPFVGKNAFSHKAGVHADAVMKEKTSYEHMEPSKVGNQRQILISDQAGMSSLLYKAKELGVRLKREEEKTRALILDIKNKEAAGYEYEGADASLELYIRKYVSGKKAFFELDGYKVIVEEHRGEIFTEATVKIKVNGETAHTVSEGNGPVNALDNSLRKAISKFYKNINEIRLVDFKVRVIEGSSGTGAKVKVFIESSDKKDVWTTVGVSENMIEASWMALVDSMEYKIMKDKK